MFDRRTQGRVERAKHRVRCRRPHDRAKRTNFERRPGGFGGPPGSMDVRSRVSRHERLNQNFTNEGHRAIVGPCRGVRRGVR